MVSWVLPPNFLFFPLVGLSTTNVVGEIVGAMRFTTIWEDGVSVGLIVRVRDTTHIFPM
jgi:hypothetical protein